MLAFLLYGVRSAVQAELDGFFTLLERRIRLPRVVTALGSVDNHASQIKEAAKATNEAKRSESLS